METASQQSGKAGTGAAWATWAVLACALLVFALLTLLSMLKFAANNYSIDVGNFLQAFHRSLEGEWMVTTLDGEEGNYSRWSGHTEFHFGLLFPLFALFPHAWTLFAMQAAAIASGGIAVFLLARARWGNDTHALLVALAFWAFPFLSHLQLGGFHADPFLITPYLLAWLFHVRGKAGWFWAMVALATSVKEYACVFNFLLGLMVFRDYRRKAWTLFALSLTQFLVITPLVNWAFHVIPLALNVEAHVLPVGRGPAAFFKTLIHNASASEYILKTAAVAALFGWSWIRFPKGLLLVAPLYGALTVLATDALFVHHHFSMLLPALFITFIEAFAGMDAAARGRYLAWGMLAPSLLLLVGHPASQVSTHLREVFLHPEYRNLFHYRITPHDRMTDALLADIPKELALATEHNLRPKAADREWTFIHPHPKDSLRADRYLFDFFETTGLGGHGKRRERCAVLLRSQDFHLERFEDGVVLISKGPLSASGDSSLFHWSSLPDSGVAEEPSQGKAVPVRIQGVLRRTKEGYLLDMDYRGNFGPAEALVSVFTQAAGDSLRVLHLPGYLETRLSGLPTGHYRERIPFQGPPDLKDGGWHWEIRLYRGHPYLPLVGRPDQVLERRAMAWNGDSQADSSK